LKVKGSEYPIKNIEDKASYHNPSQYIAKNLEEIPKLVFQINAQV